MMHRFLAKALPVTSAVAGLLLSPAAHAGNPLCSSLPQPLYVQGSSAPKPFLAALGASLSATVPPVTVVYQALGSCPGVEAIVQNVAMVGTASYFTGTAAKPTTNTCNLDSFSDPVNVGVSDVYPATCGYQVIPPGVQEFYGPNQVMNFVVPLGSPSTAISAQAAYLVFGFGGGTGFVVSPWINPLDYFIRPLTSGTLEILGAAIQVPGAQWMGDSLESNGVTTNSSGDVISDLQMTETPQNAIGILASTDADANRSTLKILAYQHFAQYAAYWPDSTPTALDKQNVRDGHYPLWGPEHFITNVDGNGNPTNPLAAQFIGYFTRTVQPPASIQALGTGVGDGMIVLEHLADMVPQCSMLVDRTSEVGPLSPKVFQTGSPNYPCLCDFVKIAAGAAPASCVACTSDAACTGTANPHCRYGFCEAN